MRIWSEREETGLDAWVTRLAIADDGVGIADAAFPHLFDGYLQVAPERKTVDNQRSMGIGLSVCRTIVQAHGGKLTARNRPEGGAEFRFSLPCEEMLPIS